MKNYHNILEKLNRFSQKYYRKMLLKGSLLFASLGLLFFLTILAVEYFLWLGSLGRLVLLIAFIGIELMLLYTYIIVPLTYLFKLKRGISNKEASLLIGRHFPNVNDKLYNLLDLKEDTTETELLLASIEQRSANLSHVPFVNAVNLRESVKYGKYLIFPFLVFVVIGLSGNLPDFLGSYKRVVNYDTAYEQPAPFVFELISKDLQVLEGETYSIQVGTEGEVRPAEITININDMSYVMEGANGFFQHTLIPPLSTGTFWFSANGIRSREYTLEVLKTPLIENFEMELQYPKYLGKKNAVLVSTGNAEFPEGTTVIWKIRASETKEVHFTMGDSVSKFRRSDKDAFKLERVFTNTTDYTLSTTNENVSEYEQLSYKLNVIKDAYPTIKVDEVLDSINPNVGYYSGEATDDYRLKEVRVVYYIAGQESNKKRLTLINASTNFESFYYTFPSGLDLEDGEAYKFYFEALDNDGLRGGKVAKSRVFGLRLLDDNELINNKLNNQKDNIKRLNKTLDRAKEAKEVLSNINKEQKEKKNLNFNDKSKIKDFLQKQGQQEQLMEKFTKELKENLEDSQSDEKSKLLKERLERQEKEAAKNAKLLKELEKVADKINKEELSKRLEELGKKQQNSQRNLEQLVELTKRYYVTEKASQLAKDLEKLARRQDILSDLKVGEDFSKDEQSKLNEKFKNLAKDLEELKKDNEALKKPLDLTIDKNKQEEVKKDQQEALEELGKEQNDKEAGTESSTDKENVAKKKQKEAASKIKKIAEDLKSSAAAGGGSSISEDAEMLRQILDNLVSFSFKQEQLYDKLAASDGDISQFSGTIREQQELRNLFEHVDDSLFALSLRRAELSEFVNEQITEVYYNTDKALENISERKTYQGAGFQQRVLTASNGLADFLANILDNMQSSMNPGSGSGKGGFQLPDIIKSQESLGEKLGEAGEKGDKGKGKEGEEGDGQEGKGKGEGEGKEGKDGKDGSGNSDGNNEGGKGGNGSNGEGQEKGSGNGGNGNGEPSEAELQEIYEIYKEQQAIRQRLEKQLTDLIRKQDQDLAKKLVQQMEDFENDLLQNGITDRTRTKANIIQHQLLKLENAALKQGEKKERESNTNYERFQNLILTKPELLKNNKSEIEILNRQALPLHQIFQNKVKNYFRKND